MSNTSPNHQQHCPYLGLQADRASIFAEPTEEHRCHVAEERQRIDLDHQVAFCLTSTFGACPRFVPLPDRRPPSIPAADLDDPFALEDAAPAPPPWLPYWLVAFLGKMSVPELGVWIAMTVLVLAVVYLYLVRPLAGSVAPTDTTLAVVAPSPSPTEPLTPTPTLLPPTAAVVASTPTPPPPMATLAPGRSVAALAPARHDVGWVFDGDTLNHFGDRNLHAGVFDGHTYHGAVQFSLASIPLGSRIEQATIEVVGLSAEHTRADAGTWVLHLLGREADENWQSASYDQIHNAPVADTIPPELRPDDLAARQVNVFTFTPAQRAELERRLEARLVSFRLDGPTEGEDNLFTWDTGYGGGFGTRPVLRLVYQPPPTPTPIVVAAIPATPTPANIVTAAAMAATATYEATAVGTATPWPPNVATATPPFVITNTPTPGNAATAEWMAAVATARAFLTGTPTPLPPYVWTATPVPTLIVVTATPTPANIVTAAAIAATATYKAAAVGTATPWPPGVATATPPVVITNTPIPGNAATAEWVAAVATAQAFLTGTPTPLPPYVWTATPVPTPLLLVPLDQITPTPVPPTATPTPSQCPAELKGKIVFRSDRLGGEAFFAMDPDGSNVALLANPWAYDCALTRQHWSASGRKLAYVSYYLHTDTPAIYIRDTEFGNKTWLCTTLGAGIAYDPAWSPVDDVIAFVSNDSANDEIWTIRQGPGHICHSARQLTHNDWEWDKHPSWSPDGQQIVFWSNRWVGRKQIWVMNADGSNPYNISNNEFNDWDPIWVR